MFADFAINSWQHVYMQHSMKNTLHETLQFVPTHTVKKKKKKCVSVIEEPHYIYQVLNVWLSDNLSNWLIIPVYESIFFPVRFGDFFTLTYGNVTIAGEEW
jgi:hypothetical protein